MAPEREPLPLARYLPELERLSEAGADFILVAGQAVNFWATHFSEIEPKLLEFAPFVSKDVDLFGSMDDLYRIPKILSGKLQRVRDLRTPVIGVFTTDDVPSLMFELLRDVYGPVSTEKIIERSRQLGVVRVIDPLSLLVAKTHNAAKIDQEKRQDVRHVQIMSLAVSAHFIKTLGAVGEQVTPRMFINEVRYLLNYARDKTFQTGLALAETKLANVIPSEEIKQASVDHPTLERFLEGTLDPFLNQLS
ncbi:MAG: hypothetical protein AAF585_04430 [Verrucomicrobiota bacterium]